MFPLSCLISSFNPKHKATKIAIINFSILIAKATGHNTIENISLQSSLSSLTYLPSLQNLYGGVFDINIRINNCAKRKITDINNYESLIDFKQIKEFVIKNLSEKLEEAKTEFENL